MTRDVRRSVDFWQDLRWTEPVSAAEAEQMLVSAFPDVPPDQVREDLTSLINGLDARGFLVRVD